MSFFKSVKSAFSKLNKATVPKFIRKGSPKEIQPGYSLSDQAFDLSGDKAAAKAAQEANIQAGLLSDAQTAFNNVTPWAAAPPMMDTRTNPTGNYSLLAQMLSRGPIQQQPAPTGLLAPPNMGEQAIPAQVPLPMENTGLLADDQMVGMAPRRSPLMYQPYGK